MRSALLVCDRGALVKHLRERFAINWHGDHGAALALTFHVPSIHTCFL